MKLALRLLIVSIAVLTTETSNGQEIDSTEVSLSKEIYDPAQNRLFMMSTGRTMPEGKFSIGDFEIFLLQAGYAPTKYLHFNASYVLPIGGSKSIYWSLGTKVQVLNRSGNFYGLSVGADIGFFDELLGFSSTYKSQLISVNAAASFGNEHQRGHVNIAQLFPVTKNSSSSNSFPTFLQFGTDVNLHRNQSGGGNKLIAEMLVPINKNGLSGVVIFVGMRVCGKASVFDICWPLVVGSGAAFSPIPFASFTLVF